MINKELIIIAGYDIQEYDKDTYIYHNKEGDHLIYKNKEISKGTIIVETNNVFKTYESLSDYFNNGKPTNTWRLK